MASTDLRIIKGKISIFIHSKIAEHASKKKACEDNGLAVPKGLNFKDQELAFNTGLRKATISEILNCKSLIKLPTLIEILNSFNISFSEFVKEYEEMSDENALAHFEKVNKK